MSLCRREAALESLRDTKKKGHPIAHSLTLDFFGTTSGQDFRPNYNLYSPTQECARRQNAVPRNSLTELSMLSNTGLTKRPKSIPNVPTKSTQNISIQPPWLLAENALARIRSINPHLPKSDVQRCPILGVRFSGSLPPGPSST